MMAEAALASFHISDDMVQGQEVNTSAEQASLERIVDLLGNLRTKGVSLWSENGQLRFRAPKGALTQEEIEGLRAHKGPIVSILQTATSTRATEPTLEPGPRRNPVPLSFSQIAHWNQYQLDKRPSSVILLSATRLRGRLNLKAFRKSVADVVSRHDALRTRIIVRDGIPEQQIESSVEYELEVEDLADIPVTLREARVERLLQTQLTAAINVASEALFRVRLLRLGEDEHVLLVLMEHLISDGFSMAIFFRELWTAYTLAVKGQPFSPPAILMQFADYAIWQRNQHASWIAKNGAYWKERLKGCQRVRFPTGQLPTQTKSGLGNVLFQIDRDLKAELLEWCQQRKTTTVIGVFTAYVALVLRWCNVLEAVFPFEIDGRISPKIEGAIGYFAFPLYLRLGIAEEDRLLDLLRRVTDEYCSAYEHADFSYMESQVPRPEFTRNCLFNWSRQAGRIGPSELDESQGAIECSQIVFDERVITYIERDSEPHIAFRETDEQIFGGVQFSLDRLSFDAAESFARNLIGFVRVLLSRPETRVRDIPILK